jgi:serine/threonine-protein kinase HipA
MSTIIHTPGERDTALDLYEKDYQSEYYATYGHYGRTEFIEFAKRLGIVEVRYMRIIDEFINNKKLIILHIEKALLSEKTKILYKQNLINKINRIK